MKYRTILTFFFLFAGSAIVSARVVESRILNFPVNGRVRVESRVAVGRFPEMVFISIKTHKVLLRSSITDPEKWLIPDVSELTPPDLRFRTISSRGFRGPVVMSVAVRYGGSDHGFFLVPFGEINGKIRRLIAKPISAPVQGGYFIGYLNKKFGYGLAAWSFIWGKGPGECHYCDHKYELDIYQLTNGVFRRRVRRVSKNVYGSENNALAFRELGLEVRDQRKGIPLVKRALY